MQGEVAAYAVSIAIGCAAFCLSLLLSLRYGHPVLRRTTLFHASLLIMAFRLGAMSLASSAGFRDDLTLRIALELFYLPSVLLFASQGIPLIREMAGYAKPARLALYLTSVAAPFAVLAIFADLSPWSNYADYIVMWGSTAYILAFSILKAKKLFGGPWRKWLLALLSVSIIYFLLSMFWLLGLPSLWQDYLFPGWFASFSMIIVMMAFDAVLKPPRGAPGGPASSPLLASLSPREFEVAGLLLQGKAPQEIATTLFISAKTVEHHLSSIYRKTAVKGKFELLALLKDKGI